MGYKGSQITIPLGQLGLLTDDTASALPVNSLAQANNIAFKGGRLSKMFGSTKYNTANLAASILAVFDYWPTPSTQRMVVATDDGKIFRDLGDGSFDSTTPMSSLNAVNTSHMLTAGNEVAGNNKKLFVLSDTNQIQVIDGDASTTRNINLPAIDWQTGNYPTFAVPYQNKIVVLGSAADPHRLYFSTVSDHENFAGQQIPTSRWQLTQRIAATPNVDLTATVQAHGAAVIFHAATNNNGYIIGAIKPFNKFTMTVSVVNSTVGFTTSYEYWNGSAWAALTLTTTPSYDSLGSTTAEFVIPSSWVAGVGTEGVADPSYYNIRVLQTVHSNQEVTITSLAIYNTTFDALPDTVSVYPGEGEKLICAQEYRGLLFIFKKPYGAYILDGRNPDSAQWSLYKYSDAFGVASPKGVIQVLGDMIAANSIGSFTSLQASNTFGDFEPGDILANNKVEDYIRDQLNFAGISDSQAIYYPEKKIAMWTGSSSSTGVKDRILAIDVAAPNPRISIITKDAPNALGLRKDNEGILRPFYGDINGDVYLMDSNTYNVGASPYLAEFRTNDSDLGQMDSQLAGKNKIFDFIEVSYIPTGNNTFKCDVYIDGELRDTKTFTTVLGAALDSFVLDSDVLTGTAGTRRDRQPLRSCTGNKIALHFYNNGNNEGFTVERVILNFRLSSDQLYAAQTGA